VNRPLPVPVPYVRPHPRGKSLPSAGVNPPGYPYPRVPVNRGEYQQHYGYTHGEASHHQGHAIFTHKSHATQQGSAYASGDHHVTTGGGHVPEARNLPPLPRLPYGPGFYIPQGLSPNFGIADGANAKHGGRVLNGLGSTYLGQTLFLSSFPWAWVWPRS